MLIKATSLRPAPPRNDVRGYVLLFVVVSVLIALPLLYLLKKWRRRRSSRSGEINGARADDDDKALLVQRCHDLEAAVAGREEDLSRVRSDLTRINTDMQSRMEILSSEKIDAEAAVVETRRDQEALFKEKAHVEMRCRKLDAEAASKTEEAGAQAGEVARADTVRKGEVAREVSAAPALVPAKPIGIENKGNQCSLNAVVQLLRHFAPFREEMIALKAAQTPPQGPTIGIPPKAAKGVIASTTKSRRQIRLERSQGRGAETLTASLATLLSKMEECLEKEGYVYVARPIWKKFLNLPLGENRVYAQADASEVLIKLLDVLSTEAGKREALGLKELPSLKAWCGELDIVQECSCGGTFRTRKDWFRVLTVPLMDEVESITSVSLVKLLEKRFVEEVSLCGRLCGRCEEAIHSKEQAPQRTMVSLAPQKLFVQLMRMSWGAGTGCKVKTLVNFPEVLDISLYSGEPGVYDLDGVIHHVETGASRDLASTSYRGHFLTFVRTGGQCWRKFDDVEISSATLAEVVTADAYILSYTRRCS